MTIQIKEGRFTQFTFTDLSRLVVLAFFFIAGTGVVFLEFIDRFLFLVDFFKQRLQVWELYLRLLGEVKNSLADRAIHLRPSYCNIVRLGPAVQVNLVRN